MTMRHSNFAIALTLILLLSGGSARAELNFGVAAEPNQPFSYKDASGNWRGWEIDLMNSVCAEMKEECVLVETAWDGLIPALLSRKIDVIWSSMAITPKRRQTIEFTKMYYDTANLIVGAKNG